MGTTGESLGVGRDRDPQQTIGGGELASKCRNTFNENFSKMKQKNGATARGKRKPRVRFPYSGRLHRFHADGREQGKKGKCDRALDPREEVLTLNNGCFTCNYRCSQAGKGRKQKVPF